jgi:L-alanine-DL-glutamate epimerase-like enolase superfamily enzyme
VDTAIRCLHELEECQIALNEQPTPDGDYAAIARVRRETRPPVMGVTSLPGDRSGIFGKMG